VRIGIRATNADVLRGIERALPPGWAPSSARVVDQLYSIVAGGLGETPNLRQLNLAYGNDVLLARARDLPPIHDALETDMQAFVAEASRTRVFVHAAVVEWRGRAIVMPGSSFAGKSTLAAAFVRAGSTYYSDEYAVFDERGRVHPYARPIALRPTKFGRPVKHPVDAFGGRIGSAPLPVGVVLVSQYEEDGRWQPRQLPPAQGALALLAHAVAARRDPARALAALGKAAARATTLESVRGEAVHVVEGMARWGSGAVE
jgi:hypothetical protein